MNQVERSELLTALYQTSSKQELLKKFDADISITKGTKTQRYTHLLEQIVFYSHAIIFGHGIQTAHNYRQSFMTTAKANKFLKLNDEKIEEAFSFLNRTEKKSILKVKQPEKEPKSKTIKEGEYCVAKEEIERLKAQLDSKSYELAKGQKADDKEIFIKVALLALGTGSRLKEITESLTVSTRKGTAYFDDGKESKEGVILVLDIKTVQSYLKAIHAHYSERIAKGTDISTGIRKAVKRLEIAECGNLNDLNAIYNDCIPKEG
jgi:hypothetical protein